MSSYTYREILEDLLQLSFKQLDMTASVYDRSINEVIPIKHFYVFKNIPSKYQDYLDGVVEEDQPLFMIGYDDDDDDNDCFRIDMSPKMLETKQPSKKE